MSIIVTVLGLLGAVLIVVAYALLEKNKLSAQGFTYYLINGVGALLVLLSLAYDFDRADLGGVVLELCWIVISLMGIFKFLSSKMKAE